MAYVIALPTVFLALILGAHFISIPVEYLFYKLHGGKHSFKWFIKNNEF